MLAQHSPPPWHKETVQALIGDEVRAGGTMAMPTDPVQDALTAAQEQLRQSRQLTEDTAHLLEAAQDRAESVQKLVEETDRLVEAAQVTSERADDLTIASSR
jgi:F0F1-type ATP synthase membrane subunit b/b'